MGLQGQIDARLWSSVQKSFEEGDFTGSVQDGFYFLSDLIRNKSGCESDGVALIGAAFGGANPVVKINALQTESEQSEQRGLEQLLRGLYIAIRNPRSHEKRVDSAENAEAIITFISFLIGMIDKSRSPLDAEQIIRKVFDKHFVPSSQYADALASKIPLGRRYDVATQIFQRRTEGKTENVALFSKALLATLSEEGRASYWEMVSTALEEASTDAEFRTAVQISSAEWTKLSEIARLRTEHRLIASIKEGEYDSDADSCPKGALGTWAYGLTPRFTMKSELGEALIDRISSGGQMGVAYVLKYFSSELLVPKMPPGWRLAYAIRARLDADDEKMSGALWFVGTSSCHLKWNEELKESLDKYKQRNPERGITDDDIPF